MHVSIMRTYESGEGIKCSPAESIAGTGGRLGATSLANRFVLAGRSSAFNSRAFVERVYLQAERNFPISGNEEAAGTMYRKALDIGLKIIDPSVTGILKDRIAKLVQQNRLTPALGEWADQIRLLGNEAAHEIDQPTREEVEALRNFSDLVLRYLFTLPAMVAARKAPVSASDK